MHLARLVRLRSRLRRPLVVCRAARIGSFLLHQVLDERERLVPVKIGLLAVRAELLERSGFRHRAHRVGRVREIGVAPARDLVVAEAAGHRVIALELRRGDVRARLEERRLRREARVKESREADGRVVVAEARSAAPRFRHVEAAVGTLGRKNERSRLFPRFAYQRREPRFPFERRRQRPKRKRCERGHLGVAPVSVDGLLGEQELRALLNGDGQIRLDGESAKRCDQGNKANDLFHANPT